MFNITNEQFIEKLFELLPEAKETFKRKEKYLRDGDGNLLYTVVVEDVFMKHILDLLRENKEIKRLKKIFDYFEKVCNSENKRLIGSIFAVTVLETLEDNEDILPIAKGYMGQETTRLHLET